MKCGARPRITGSLFLALLTPPCCADPAPVIHYAPGENLEHVDVALIDRAEHEIDMAAYVLTDWPVTRGAVLMCQLPHAGRSLPRRRCHTTCKSSATSSLWRCVSVLAKTDFN